MPGLDLWAEQRGDIEVAVLLQDRRIVAIEIDNAALGPQSGEVFAARITSLQPRQRSAEVDLGTHGLAFLDLGKKTFSAGDVVQVEWLNPAQDAKLQTVRLHEGKATAKRDALTRITAGREIAAARINTPNQLARLAEMGIPATQVPDPFALYDIDSQLRGLLERQVELPQSGSLVIDQLEALTVIDVNGGKVGLGINALALPEIARQLRLRNIGGMVLVDMVGGRDEKLVTALRPLVADDASRVEVFGITRLGLIEITRQRRGYPLAQALRGFPLS